MSIDCLRLGECLIVRTPAGYIGALGDLQTEPRPTEWKAIRDLITITQTLIHALVIANRAEK